MRKILVNLFLLIGLTQTAAAASAAASVALNVRDNPGTRSQIVDTLFPGERVTILDCEDNWCYIRHPGPDGWVSARYLILPSTHSYRKYRDPCDVDPTTEFHMRFGLYHTPLAKYCRERND